MFVNRPKELKTLNREYKRVNSSFTVIYGRRRVGKTTLIKEFIKDKERIYYYATEINIAMQLKSFTRDVLEALKQKSILINSPLERRFVLFSKSGFSDSLKDEEVACFVV